MEVNVTQASIDLLFGLYGTLNEIFECKDDIDNELKSGFDSKWNELLKEMENNEYYASSMFCVYYHLRLKNWRIGCGTKYGAHFLLYPKEEENSNKNNNNNKNKNTNSSSRIHSKYLVLHNFDIGNDQKLHSYVRLCRNIKKTLVLTSFSEEKSSEFIQDSVLNQEWMNNLNLTSVSCDIVQ